MPSSAPTSSSPTPQAHARAMQTDARTHAEAIIADARRHVDQAAHAYRARASGDYSA